MRWNEWNWCHPKKLDIPLHYKFWKGQEPTGPTIACKRCKLPFVLVFPSLVPLSGQTISDLASDFSPIAINLGLLTLKADGRRRVRGCRPVSRWCLGRGVSVVSRWCLGCVSVVSRWCLGGVSVVSRWCLGVRGVSVMSRWCLGGVSVVSWWCLQVVSPGGVSVVSRCCLGRVLVVSELSLGGVSLVSLGGVSVVSGWCLGCF